MKHLFKQTEGEQPLTWLTRLMQALAPKLVVFVAAMFVLGYIAGC